MRVSGFFIALKGLEMHGSTAQDCHDVMEKVLDTCKKEDREEFLRDIIWILLLDIEKERTCLDSFHEEMNDHLKD